MAHSQGLTCESCSSFSYCCCCCSGCRSQLVTWNLEPGTCKLITAALCSCRGFKACERGIKLISEAKSKRQPKGQLSRLVFGLICSVGFCLPCFLVWCSASNLAQAALTRFTPQVPLLKATLTWLTNLDEPNRKRRAG